MKKKILLAFVVLALGGFQMPVLADSPPLDDSLSTWAQIITALGDMDAGYMQYALAPGITITQANQTIPQGGLISDCLSPTLNFQGSTISGQVAKATLLEPNPYVLSNNQNTLTLKNGTITSNDLTGHYIAIQNDANQNLTNMTVIGGVAQIWNSSTTSILGAGGSVSNLVTLSGGNSFASGTIDFTGTGSSTLIFDGGSFASDAVLKVTGAGNTLNVKSGTVVLDGVAASNQKVDTWNSGAIVGASGTGNLTFNNFSNDSTTGAYNQTGGTLNLTNNSTLTLQSGALITTGGNGGDVTTVNIGNSTNQIDGSSLVLSAGSNIKSANAGDILALNIGNATDFEAQVTVNGGTIDKSVAINLTNSNDLVLNSGSVTFNDSALATESGDNWNGGYVYVNGGTLTLDNFTHDTSNGLYQQTGGTLNIINGSNFTFHSGITAANSYCNSIVNVGGSGAANTMIIENGTITSASGGTTTVNIGNGSNGNTLNLVQDAFIKQGVLGTTTVNIGDINSTGNTLVISGTSSIDNAVAVVINANNTLNLQAGATTLDSSDTWKGNVIVDGGSLTMSGMSNQTGSTLNQSSGGTYVYLDSILTLGAGSSITGGSLTAYGGATGNIVNVTGGTIAEAAVVDIETGNTLNISAGSVTLDGQNTTADTWNGTVNLSGTGNLTLDNVNNSAPNGAYFQTGGTLNLTNGSDLKIQSSGPITTSGHGVTSTVNIGGGNASNLTMLGGSITTADSGGSTIVNVGNGSDGNTLDLNYGGSITSGTSGTTLVNVGVGASKSNSLTMEGGDIKGTSTVNIGTTTPGSASNSLTMTGGTIYQSAVIAINENNTLNLIGTQATFNGADTWAGNVNLSGGGTLNISELQSNGAYSQINSTLNISTVANLSLSAGSTITTDGVGTATVNIGGGPTGSILSINGGSITTADAGGTTILNIGTAGDYLVNTVNVTSGSITNGTSGTTNVNIGLGSGGAGKLNLSGGSITGSGTTVNIGTTTVGSSNNTLTVSGTGVLDQSATVAINASNYLNVQGGSATLNTGDTWLGNVALSGGNLTLNNITHNTINGNYSQTAGELNLVNNSTLNLNTGSSITGGVVDVINSSLAFNNGAANTAQLNLTSGTVTVNAGSTFNTAATGNTFSGGNVVANGLLNLVNTDTETLASTVTGTGTINKTTAGMLNFTTNQAGFTGTYNQTLGTVNVSNNFFSGANNLTGGTVNILNNGSLTLNAGDTWTGTNVSNSDGVFNLSGISHTTGGTYNQSAGILNLNNNSGLTLASGSAITGGNANLVGSGNNLNIAGGSFASGATLNLAAGSNLNLSSGTVALSNTDTWAGAVNVSGGSLALSSIASNGIFTQTAGTTALGSSSALILGSGSAITGGNVNFVGIGNNLNIADGNFGSGATLNLTAGNNLNLSSGTVALNGSDTWAGAVDVSGGTMLLDSIASNGTYNQSAGTLNLNNASTLTLGNGTSITGGNVNLVGVGNNLNITGGSFGSGAILGLATGSNLNLSNGTLALNNADTWAGAVNVSGGSLALNSISSNGILNQSAGLTTLGSNSTLTLGPSSEVSGGSIAFAGTGNALAVIAGGIVDSNATINLSSGNYLNVSGGNVTLNGTGTGIDTWAGSVNLSGTGNLTSNYLLHNTVNGAYSQTGGTLNLVNGASLLLGQNGSITSGTVNVHDLYSSLDLTNDGVLASDAILNLSAENYLNIQGGTATLSGTGTGADNLAGNITVQSGNLALNGITSIGGFEQSGGSTTLGGNSTLTLTTSKLIFGGNFGFSGTGNNLNIANGSLGSGVALNLTAGNNLNMTSGNIALNSNDTWAGAVNVTGGFLTTDGVTSNGLYTQNGGTLILGDTSGVDSTLTLGAGSYITSGTAAYTGTGNTLNIGNGANFGSAAVLALTTANNFNVTGGTATLGANDNWSGLGSVLVNGGTLNLDRIVSNGIYCMSGGTTNLTAGTTLNYGNASSLGGGTFNNAGVLNISHTNQNYVGSNFTGNGVINKNGTGETIFTSNGQTFTGTYDQTAGTTNIHAMADNTSGTFFQNAVKKFESGAVSIASGAGLILKSTDSWANTNITNAGIFALDNFTHNTTGIGSYHQTNGNLLLANGSALTLGAGSTITGGNVLFSGTGSALNIAGGSLTSAATVNLSAGHSMTISDGTATFNAGDTWKGALSLSGGALNLDGFIHDTTTAVAYSQSGGLLTLTNGSVLRLGAGSSITGGVLLLDATTGHTGNVLDVATGATFNPNFAFDITANNSLTVSGGNATVDSLYTNWDGVIGINAGTLDLKRINGHGIYNQTGGTTTIEGNSKLVLLDTSNLSNGILNNNGELHLSNENAATVGTRLGGTGTIFKDHGGDTTFTADNSGFTGTYNQTAGNAIIQNNFFTGNNKFDGGTAEIKTGGNVIINNLSDSWTTTNITNSGGTFDLNNITHDASSAGTYTQTAGTTILNSGAELNLALVSSTLSGGRIIDNGVLGLTTTNAGQTVGASLSGNGIINKEGNGTLLLTGQNLGFLGTLNIKGGTVDFNASSGFTDSYISGQTNLLNNGTLNLAYDRSGLLNSPLAIGSSATVNLNTGGNNVVSLSNNISGTGTLNKDGAGEYRVYAGSNGNFNYGLNVNAGTMTLVTDNTANFNNTVNVNSSILRVSSSGTNFNDGLALDHGYLSILNGGFNVLNGFSVGSTVNTMNGAVATNNITGNLNIGASGISEYLIDISPSAGTSDKYAITGNITKDASLSSGTIKVSDFKIVGPHTLVQSVALKVFDAPTATITDPNIYFTATDKTITTALGQYGLSSQGSGNYLLSWKDFNPQVFRGQVATEAAYANQLTTNNILFDHISLISQQLLAEDKPNVYASENPLFAPYQYSKKDGGLWYKAYGNLERLQLTQGINTQNNMWGSMVGADFPVVELKHGWKLLPTAYVGYTGAYQTYSGVNMYQNGGQGGIMGTFYKGDFITSLLANVGGYGNDMNVNGAKDTTGNWFAGVASKSAYNIKLPKHFILQPNMLVSYNAFGGQNWSTDFGSAAMSTNMMNGLNLAPGLNLIYSKDSWSVYATTQLMCNLMNGTSGSIDDVSLPTVKMGSTYFQYGLGVTKRIKDRLSMYTQVVMSNGVRTGIGFQGGFQWKF